MDVQRIELEADRIVAEELDRARQKIIEHHVAAGQRTTGTTADSITIALFRNGGREDIFTPEIAALSDRIADRLAGLFDAQIVESILRQ